jgi:hypothetical protein
VTAQGEDVLAWLDDATTARETAATAAHATDPAPWNAETDDRGTFDHAREAGSGLVVAANGISLWDCEGSSGLCMTAAASVHAALHDPESVLRRCAADRKLLKLHQPVVLHAGGGARYFETTTVCKSCEPPKQFPETAFPCPTVLAIAEGYGWTGGER